MYNMGVLMNEGNNLETDYIERFEVLNIFFALVLTDRA